MMGLKVIRKHKGFTQRQLGDNSATHLNTINRYENGTQFPESMQRVKAIADALGCEPWHLFHPDPLAILFPVESLPPASSNPELARKLLTGFGQKSRAWSQQRRTESEDEAESA